jgi:hypothetical protein
VVVAIGAVVLLAGVEQGAQADATRSMTAATSGGRAAPTTGVDAAAARSWAGDVFVPLLLLALLAARPLLLLRPVVLTLLFAALFVWVIERFRAGGRARVLWLLPALQIVWVNCQGLSALGPAIIVCHAVGAAIAARWGRAELPQGGPRRLLLVGVACLAAGFITPYGLRGFLFPLRLLARIQPGAGNIFSENIAENVPPFVLARTAPGELWHLPWFLALLAVSFVVARRELVLGRCLAAAAFVALALMATRNVLLAYWIGTPIVALNVAPWLAQRLSQARARAGMARFVRPTLALVLLAIGTLTVLSLRRETALAAPAPFRVPADSVATIARRGGQGAIFAADHYGGYVIWALFPDFRPFIDTRLILRTADEYQEFLGALGDPKRFDDLQRRHQFSYVLVPSAFPDRYLGLIQHLYQASEWKLIHTDGTETLFVHDPVGVEAGIDLRSRDVTTRLLASLDGRYGKDAPVLRAARLHLARLQLALGHLDEAKQVVSGAPASDVDAQSLLALAHLLAGDIGASEAVARAAVDADPRAVTPLTLLARAALQRGDRSGGLGWLRRALAIDPYDADAQALLTQMEQNGPPQP